MTELSYTVRIVLAGATLLGTTGGVLGCFALLRRQSLLGDALAHAALPGVCTAYLLTYSKQPLPLFAGALVAGLLGAWTIVVITRRSRIKEDTAIGIVLSVFFGIGILLLTYIQRLPTGNQSGLDRLLFGQAATLLERDVLQMTLLAGAVLLVVGLLFKEFKLLCFDREFAASSGLPTRRLELLLTTLLVVVVVVGLQTVGVVLIVATLITPAAAARQWTERLGVMLLLAGAIGGTAGAGGAMLSATVADLPTGPVIVLCASSVLVVSLLLAPRRGLVWATIDEHRVARRIRRENLLKDLYTWIERHGGAWSQRVPASFVMGLRGDSGRRIGRTARRLAASGSIDYAPGWLSLTDRGLRDAERVVRKHRLWELYLTRRLELASDHVHRDADTMEHALTDEAVAKLEQVLGHPTRDPHGRPIPPGRAA
ncbi:MAG TPA: iron chelate uptake ABC transporter family permease subunit [Candidatus Polarisedimenticolaceae bacterium]|nr:iron chelate uptake ABC transporter family permease subunit [Candidatus Polarisedimenticolaceae bacterium]